ncbi:serine/threonine/tyrosine-interacting protein B-like [Lineus longissimus]|uniref:serine/threonine/tyrosine-interacting protein B-like n=1 Tax=Lineus longissimus TaxID=88925 RepID=UPI002B4DE479
MESFRFLPIPPISEADTQWTYTMRRDMQEIVPNLYLGPYGAAMRSKLDNLQLHGITHIVCIRQAIEAAFVKPNFPEFFRYLVLDIADSVTENIIQHFPKVRDFIDECFRCGGKVLVHGNAGISRSAALVIAYIMERYGLPYREAFLYVQQKRFCINLNEGFAQQLKEYEPIYRAKLTLENGQPSMQTGHLKRKMDDDVYEMRTDFLDTS